MAELFGRRLELSIFTGSTKTTLARDSSGEELDMEFDIEAFAGEGPKASPNVAKITVYNLEEDKRKLFSEEHQAIEFAAGYQDEIGTIFIGETTNVVNHYNKKQVRWETTIYAGDGIKDWTSQYFNTSYSKGTTVTQILTDMAEASGLPYTIDTLDIDTLLSGENYTGLVKDVLTQICKDRGLDWSIQWGVLEITQRDSPLIKDADVEVLRADTGLIESPAIIESTVEKKPKGSGKKKRKLAVRAVSLMNPRIKPKRVVRIESENVVNALGDLTSEPAPNKDINGTYLVSKVRYYGSTAGPEFYTEIEADLQ